MSYRVYCWTNRVNGKRYVGITRYSIKRRAGNRMCQYRRCTHFWNAIQKYGPESFTCRILVDGLTKEEAERKERNYIRNYRSRNKAYGYNIKKGGYNGYSEDASKSINKRISEKLHKQRSTPRYRAIMKERMVRYWSDPRNRQAASIRRRENPGRPSKAVAVYCVETGMTYATQEECGRAIGFKRTTIYRAFKRQGTTAVIGRLRGTSYTLTRLGSV